ncbi:MAG: hypothetical protein ACREPA_07900 [Candidatus Dormibacteraceae bacterium]
MGIIEFIRDRARYYNCPVCGRSLRGCSVRMLNHVEDRFTVQVTCAACQVTFIVVLAIQGEGLEPVIEEELEAVEGELLEIGRLPESSAVEGLDKGAELEERAPPIEPDELLDLHLMLKDFQGPLADLVREPGRSRG